MIHEKVKRKTSLFVSNTWYLYRVYMVGFLQWRIMFIIAKIDEKRMINDKDLEEIKISINKQA